MKYKSLHYDKRGRFKQILFDRKQKHELVLLKRILRLIKDPI